MERLPQVKLNRCMHWYQSIFDNWLRPRDFGVRGSVLPAEAELTYNYEESVKCQGE